MLRGVGFENCSFSLTAKFECFFQIVQASSSGESSSENGDDEIRAAAAGPPPSIPLASGVVARTTLTESGQAPVAATICEEIEKRDDSKVADEDI